MKSKLKVKRQILEYIIINNPYSSRHHYTYENIIQREKKLGINVSEMNPKYTQNSYKSFFFK